MTREEDEVGQASSRNTKYESLQSEYLGISLFSPNVSSYDERAGR